MATRRPTLLNRALSTPPATPISVSTTNKLDPVKSFVDVLTPPISPIRGRSSSNLSQQSATLLLDQPPPSNLRESHANLSNCFQEIRQPRAQVADEVLICPFEVDVGSGTHGGEQIFGFGAWSTVFKGTARSKSLSTSSFGLATPPSSPTLSAPVLVAIKRAARNDAVPIIRSEGRILSYLSRLSGCAEYVVTFYGTLEDQTTLVMAAIPLSLEEHVNRRSVLAKRELTTWNMDQPVIGSSRVWLTLAHSMIRALQWLHEEAEVVHGDIKPGNFLLQPKPTSKKDEFTFQPLFIDFSSSHRLDSNDVPDNTLSAVTREYTAPELLVLSVLRDPKSTATKPSDVFSLAVTLLVAATGNTMVYAGSVFQRQAMATQGWQVLGLVRSGENGTRVPRQGIVERTLEKAVLKTGRISACQWLRLVEDMMLGEPRKKM